MSSPLWEDIFNTMATQSNTSFKGQKFHVMPRSTLQIVQEHPLLQGLYCSDIGLFPSAAGHQRERLEGCAQFILLYCTAGRGWYVFNGVRHSVEPDHWVILPPNQYHFYGADEADPWTLYWIHFTGKQAADWVRFLYGERPWGEPVYLPPNVGRLDLFLEVYQDLEQVYQLELLIRGHCGLAQFLANCQPKATRIVQDDPVARSIRYMRAHLQAGVTLEVLAEVSGWSISHYSALFKQQVQQTPLQFFTYLRVQHACQLLSYTSQRIQEVAFAVGFEDPFHFSRVFRRFMGMSPREFRTQEK